MITILVAAATGLLFSARVSLIFWILGSSLTALVCIGLAILGWSPQSLIFAILGILAYNLTFAAGTLLRLKTSGGLAPRLHSVKTVR